MSPRRPAAREASADSYAVDGLLPAPDLQSVPAGTSLLVSGPAMTGKVDLAASILARGVEREQHAIVVSPDVRAERILGRFDPADRVHVVDCSGTGGSFDDTADVKYVSSPGDLTGIGIGVAKCNQVIGAAAGEGLRLGVLSLSTLLHYAAVDPVFSFVHLLTGRIDAAGYLGAFTLDPSTQDDRVIDTLRSQFDGIVELQEAEDGTVEGRVLGVDGGSREWTPF